MNFNKYVIKTSMNSITGYFNTVNKVFLPENASIDKYKNNDFLLESEQYVVINYLKNVQYPLSICIIPTWACNLRCSHCCVLTRLDNKSNRTITADGVTDFISKCLNYKKYKRVNLSFVGGEPLLAIDYCQDILDNVKSLITDEVLTTTATTNAALELNYQNVKFIKSLSHVTISLDGNEIEHNKQRHPYSDKHISPYSLTYDNIRRLVRMGCKSLRVQASVSQEYYTIDNHKKYFRSLLEIGVHPDNIKFGCIHPTVHAPTPQSPYLQSIKDSKLRSIPCCRYRVMGSMTIDIDGNVYTNYYTQDKSTLLGTIYDDIQLINDNYNKSLNDMPILKDPICRSCPVVGYCWGNCTVSDICTDSPSQLCNQADLIKKVNEAAANGTLIKEIHPYATH